MFQTSLMRWRKVRSEIDHLQAKNAATFGHCHVVTNESFAKHSSSKPTSQSASPSISQVARSKWSLLRSKYESNGSEIFEHVPKAVSHTDKIKVLVFHFFNVLSTLQYQSFNRTLHCIAAELVASTEFTDQTFRSDGRFVTNDLCNSKF